MRSCRFARRYWRVRLQDAGSARRARRTARPSAARRILTKARAIAARCFIRRNLTWIVVAKAREADEPSASSTRAVYWGSMPARVSRSDVIADGFPRKDARFLEHHRVTHAASLHRCALRPSPVPLIPPRCEAASTCAARWSDETHELTGRSKCSDRRSRRRSSCPTQTSYEGERSRSRAAARLPASGLMSSCAAERSELAALARPMPARQLRFSHRRVDEFFFHVEVLDVHDVGIGMRPSTSSTSNRCARSAPYPIRSNTWPKCARRRPGSHVMKRFA